MSGLHGVAFGKDAFVVVGESGTILQSDPLDPATLPQGPSLLNPGYRIGAFTVSVPTASGRRYALEFTGDLSQPAWSSLATLEGDGTMRLLTDPSANSPKRFYRLRRE